MKKTLFNILLLGIILTFVSCGGDDNKPTETSIAKGLFVLNQGNYTNASSSMTFYDPETDTVANNLFYKANLAPIGDAANSMMLDETGLYIVVNGSKYIYKVDENTMKYKAKLEGLTSPRNMISISKTKAYVSDLESKGLWIINPETMQKTGFVELGNTTEAMVRIGDEVAVTNWSNFYQPETSNKTVQFVDVDADSLVAEVEVAAEPNTIVLDKNNMLWVLCSGGYAPPCEPSMFCIDASTKEVVKRIDFAEGDYPSAMAIDAAKENIYVLNGGYGTLDLYKMSVDAETFPTTPFISSRQSSDAEQARVFTNVAVSAEGDIYLTDVKNYMLNGEVLRYDSEGNFISKFETGIIPGAILFN